ncbi:MAG: MerR family transcriptional regulator [Phycisphaerae bacterium]
MAKETSKELMRLADLAAGSGLSRQTVQYYLLLGLITEANRTAGGQRLFDKDSVRRVKLIHKLNLSGYTLRDIREMFLQNK